MTSPKRPHDPSVVAAAIERQHGHDGAPPPPAVLALAAGRPVSPVWRNELGGRTFRVGDRYVKWNPHGNGIDLDRERDRLAWIAGRHPAPVLISSGEDAQGRWLVTARLPGASAVTEPWLSTPDRAVSAIAIGLRALHAVPVTGWPDHWIGQAWPDRTPPSLGARPPVDDPVLVHGDACAPNTLLAEDGSFAGHVDLGDLTVGDRWADLAVASMSLDWNYGPGHQDALFAAYGIERDPERIAYYRALWRLES